MSWWLLMLIGIAIGGIIGMFIGFGVADGGQRKDVDGILIVDPKEVMPGEGLYLQVWNDPKERGNGDTVKLRISMIGDK